ncbi:MAG TPA: dTDP-4-dehydrorhamnose reductase, partial [Pirellulales bacterium]
IAQIVNRVGGYDPHLLHGCPRLAAGPIPPRAGNVTMNSAKLKAALGGDPFDPWPLLNEHAPDGPEWHFQRPTGERGSLDQIKKLLYIHPTRPTTAPKKALAAGSHA